jgi:hypothetical protein
VLIGHHVPVFSGLGQRRRQLALLTAQLAATHYVAGDIPAAAYAFGYAAPHSLFVPCESPSSCCEDSSGSHETTVGMMQGRSPGVL